MPTISSKRIGYLRLAPSAERSARVAPSPPVKAMWRKLHLDGFLNASATKVQTFWLTPLGKEALEKFDKSLSEPCRAVLNAVKARKHGVSSMKGLMTVVEAGLVHVRESHPLSYVLTEAGERLADPIGEIGYFAKSANKVEVTGVHVGSDGTGMLEVVRTEGESKGKGMHIPRDAFVREADWATYCGG
jgi:hypothetical protein|nr:hypothetical protein [Neorhizobium tomejilense]